MRIDRLDHLVLTVADIEASAAFYSGVLGMEHIRFDGRHALRFGTTKTNLHEEGREFEPKAAHPTPGAGDICLITSDTMKHVAAELAGNGIRIEQGPIARTGALGPMRSIYIRDPDRNLIEIAAYGADASNRSEQDAD